MSATRALSSALVLCTGRASRLVCSCGVSDCQLTAVGMVWFMVTPTFFLLASQEWNYSLKLLVVPWFPKTGFRYSPRVRPPAHSCGSVAKSSVVLPQVEYAPLPPAWLLARAA